MEGDRVSGQEELVGGLPVGEALGDELGDGVLGVGERGHLAGCAARIARVQARVDLAQPALEPGRVAQRTDLGVACHRLLEAFGDPRVSRLAALEYQSDVFEGRRARPRVDVFAAGPYELVQVLLEQAGRGRSGRLT